MRVNPFILVTLNLIKGSLTLIALFQKRCYKASMVYFWLRHKYLMSALNITLYQMSVDKK